MTMMSAQIEDAMSARKASFAICFFLIFIVPSLQEFFANVNGNNAHSIISPLLNENDSHLAGAVMRPHHLGARGAPPHVQLWVFSKHL